MELRYTDINKRFQDMKTERAPMERLYRAIDLYVMDRNGELSSGFQSIGGSSINVFTKAGVKYNTRFASALQGMVAPAEQPWFSLSTNTQDSPVEHKAYLDLLENAIYQTLSQTNFYHKSLELLTDYSAFGMAGIYVQSDDKKRIKFISVPVKELYLGSDFNGEINQVARHFSVTSEALVSRFDKEISKIPTQITNDAFKNPYNKVEVVHMIVPNKGENKEEFPFVGLYFLPNHAQAMFEKTYYEYMPYITPRWSVYSGETYGRSQAMVALPDLKTLSNTIRDMLIGTARLAKPPHLLMSDSFSGAGINLTPDSFTVVDKLQGGSLSNVLSPIGTNARPDVCLQVAQEWERKIAEIFMADLIAEDKSERMTATEASSRHMLRMSNLAPQHGRLNSEYLDKLLEILIFMHIDQGIVPLPPEGLEKVEIVYNNPLTVSQKMAGLQSINQFIQSATQYASIDPSAIQYVDTGKALMMMADAMNIPQAVLRSKEEVEAALAQQKQQQEQAVQAQQNNVNADSLLKASQVAANLSEDPAQQASPSEVA